MDNPNLDDRIYTDNYEQNFYIQAYRKLALFQQEVGPSIHRSQLTELRSQTRYFKKVLRTKAGLGQICSASIYAVASCSLRCGCFDVAVGWEECHRLGRVPHQIQLRLFASVEKEQFIIGGINIY